MAGTLPFQRANPSLPTLGGGATAANARGTKYYTGRLAQQLNLNKPLILVPLSIENKSYIQRTDFYRRIILTKRVLRYRYVLLWQTNTTLSFRRLTYLKGR